MAKNAPPPAAAVSRPAPPTPAQILASRAAGGRTPEPAVVDPGPSTRTPPSNVGELGKQTPTPDVKAAPPPVVPAKPATRPGQPVVPPARIAGVAGDAAIDLGYDPGHSMMHAAPPPVVPVLSRPIDTHDPTMQGFALRPAAEMDLQTATATTSRITANLKQWFAHFPHAVAGEGALVAGFFRGLASHQRARTDALAYGQDNHDDEVADARYLPPPEAFALQAIATQVEGVVTIFERALDAAKLTLTASDQDAVNELKQMLRLKALPGV